jgi:hypothetical protein
MGYPAPLAICLGLFVGIYVLLQTNAELRTQIRELKSEIETYEALHDAPVFNPGDPAARQRLCQLLALDHCPL